jgi:uncharacterized membrane protein YeaQ/YmgE (transglycosylase-associated protein family)
MPRQKKGLDAGTVVLGILCVIVFAIVKAFTSVRDSLGLPTVITLIVGAVVLVIWWKVAAKRKKISYLMSKYGDPQIVAHIYNHQYWHGQTAEQLVDSLGSPRGVDRKLLKTMKREVWKYNPRGVNRYGLRITLDNDIVSGWDHKQ